MQYYATIADREYVIVIIDDHTIEVGGERYEVDFRSLPQRGVVSLLLNRDSLEAVVDNEGDVYEVLLRGDLYSVTVQDERSYRLARARGSLRHVTGDAVMHSPMPGIIVSVPVQPGDRVEQGDTVVILESMKMENELRAPRAGEVLRVMVTDAASVEKGQALMVIGDGRAEADE